MTSKPTCVDCFRKDQELKEAQEEFNKAIELSLELVQMVKSQQELINHYERRISHEESKTLSKDASA